jgi:antitoxin component YwqK of YwqJK toxin-antitoxin module
MRYLFRFFLLFLLLLSSPVFAQQLKLNITGYDAQVHHGYGDQYSFKVHLDSAGKLQGPVMIYAMGNYYYKMKEDSALVFRGTFLDNHLVDSATWYYSSGRKMRAAYFNTHWSEEWSENVGWWNDFDALRIEGKVEGIVTEWYDLIVDGKQPVKALNNYLKGRLNGKQLSFYASGQREEERYMVNGVCADRYTRWFENGNIAEEGNYKDGWESGMWRYYCENGQVKQIRATRSANDTITNYYSNGKLKDQTFYLDYRRQGDYFEYDTLGKKKTYKHFRNGKQDSVQINYYPSGAKAEAVHYEIGKREGQYQSWYPGSKIKMTGQYADNYPAGIWKYYRENGKLQEVINYDEMDQVVAPMIDDEDGNYVQESAEVIMTYDFNFTLPTIKIAGQPCVIAKADKMKFLKSHAFIDVIAVMDQYGKISYTVVTPLKSEDREKFTAYMNTHFGTGRPMEYTGNQIPCTMSVRVVVSPI